MLRELLPLVLGILGIFLTENATKWVKRSKQYKERAINSFCRLPLVYDVPDEAPADKNSSINNENDDSTDEDAIDNEGQLSVPAPLSISWKDAVSYMRECGTKHPL